MVTFEYYYDPHERLWRVDVLDEQKNVIDFTYGATEFDILWEIDDLKAEYTNVTSVTKTKFYKCY